MSTRAPRRSLTIAAPILIAGALAIGLTGCAGGIGGGSSVDGTYVKVAKTSGISSAWVIEGDSARFIAPGCDVDEERDAKVLSEDLTRITNPDTGENYTLTWYEDQSGFVWKGHGDFIRQDSSIGKSAVERWEDKCGKDWPS